MKVVLVEYTTTDKKHKKEIERVEKFYGKPFVDLLNERVNEKMKNQRYCTNCQTLRPSDYGKMIKAGPTMRWRCTACAERTNIPLYKKKDKNV